MSAAIGALMTLGLRRFGQIVGGNATTGWYVWLVGNWDEQSTTALVLDDDYASERVVTSPVTPPEPFTGFGERVLWSADFSEFSYGTPTQPQSPRTATVLFWAEGGLLDEPTAVIVIDSTEAIVFARAAELSPLI